MHADIFATQLRRQVPHRAFQSGLDRPHQVVVINHLFSALITHTQQGSTRRHQRLGQAGGTDKRMTGNIHGAGKATGIVEWQPALIMMLAATLGGYSGADIARALPVRVVRGIVIGVGLVMTLVFLLR
jgi:hypothetical protein